MFQWDQDASLCWKLVATLKMMPQHWARNDGSEVVAGVAAVADAAKSQDEPEHRPTLPADSLPTNHKTHQFNAFVLGKVSFTN